MKTFMVCFCWKEGDTYYYGDSLVTLPDEPIRDTSKTDQVRDEIMAAQGIQTDITFTSFCRLD